MAAESGPVLPRAFCARPVLELARDLLGRHLTRITPEGRGLTGRIVEVEAYGGADDPASHAHRGRTERNAVMFGPPGHIYVYLIYGMHHCLNIVSGAPGEPEAVLIRALEPVAGKRLIAANRPGRPRREWLAGPGRLCAGLGIDRGCNGLPLPCASLRLTAGEPVADAEVARGPRIGVDYAGDAALWPRRFTIRGSDWLSR